MKVRALALAGIGMATLPLFASADTVPRSSLELKLKDFNVEMRDYAFPSGFRVVFQSDRTQPIIATTMMIDHGSTDDPVGKEGIAHLVEHLWFRSVHLDQNGKELPKVWDLLREVGANLNATTSNDRTNYLTTAPSEHLNGMLRLESLRLREAVRGVTDENIKIEREVVRNELRLRMENGFGDAFRYISAKLYPPGHPYGRETIGTHDSLNAITLGDVQDFVKRFYVPKDSTLVVIGDFDLNDAPKLLQNFGIDQLADPANPTSIELIKEPIKRIKGASEEPPAPPQPLFVKGETIGLTSVRAATPEDKTALMVGWTMPGAYREDEPVLYGATNLLSFALGQELDPEAKVQSFGGSSDYGCFPNGGTLSVAALCYVEVSSAEKGQQMADRVLDSLTHLSTTEEYLLPALQSAFSRARQQQLASIIQDVDLVSDIFAGRATVQADFLHFTGDPLYFSRQLEWTGRNFTFEKVRAVAMKYFTRARAAAILVQPYEEGDINIETSDAQYKGARRDDVLNTVLTEAQLNDEVIKRSTRPPDAKKAVVEKLPNGATLVVMPHSQAPIVRTSVWFHGGSYGSKEAMFAQDHWYDNGSIDPLRVAGFVTGAVGQFSTHLDVSGSAGNLADVLYILREKIDNIVADTNGKLDWQDALRKDVTGTLLKEPEAYGDYLRGIHILPNHWSTRMFDHAFIKETGSLSNAVVNEYLNTLLQPSNTTLFIVGNITADEARTHAKTYFGGWQGRGTTKGTVKLRDSADPPTQPLARKLYVIDRPNRSQTQVGYSCQLASKTEEDQSIGHVMADAISESTWLALREQTGASYGAGAGTAFYKGAYGTLAMGVSVQNDTAGMAAKVFLDLGERARDNKLDSKTIQVVKYNRAQQYVQGHQSTSQMMARLQSVLGTQRWGMDFFSRYPALLSSVKGSDFAALLAPCVGYEAVTLVGPKEVIQPQVEKLGYAWELVDLKKVKTDYYTAHGLKLPKDDEEKKKN